MSTANKELVVDGTTLSLIADWQICEVNVNQEVSQLSKALLRTTVLIEENCTKVQKKNRLLALQMQTNRALLTKTTHREVDEVS